MTKRIGALYALSRDLVTYSDGEEDEIVPEGTPVKVHMKFSTRNGLRYVVVKTADRLGIEMSDHEAEELLRAPTAKERRAYKAAESEES